MTQLNSAFVTGAGGFIGRHLVRQLLATNVEVVALMMPGEPVPDEWGTHVRCVMGDVRQLASLGEEIGCVDVVFHLAAVVSDWGAQQHHVDITVHGTEQAIELALQWDAHFVVTTSVCAYASVLAKGELREDMPVGTPSSPYEFCKQEQERVTLEAVQQHQFKASIVRPGNVFGVGSGPWVNTMIEMLRQQQPCLLGSGDWDAGLCHVNNLVAILIAAAGSDHNQGEIFNAADGFGVTWKTYLTRLAQVANTPPPKSLPNLLAKFAAPVLEKVAKLRKQEERPLITQQSYRLIGGPNQFSISKAQKLLDYQPVVSFEQAMQELADDFGYLNDTTTTPWVWVTGSASGLGRYLTGQLLQKGYRVLATDLSQDALLQARDEDAWPHDRVALESLNITELTEWQELLEKYQQQGVKFSHLLNVAGIIRPGFAYENTASEIGMQVNVNLMGTVNGCDVLLPHFTANSSGHLINVASYAGFGPVPGVVGYSTSKAAVRSFSNGLAMDLNMSGSPVNVSCVCPDLIATPMMDRQVNYGEHARLVFSGKRPLTTDEVAQVILGEVWEQQPIEVAIPKVKGWGIRLMGLNPDISLWLSRQIEKKGIKNLNSIRSQES
jgi:nucleoside-diphosphate-sugar epimerase